MLNFSTSAQPLCDGLSRREWLRIGAIGLGGLSLGELLRRRAEGNDEGGRGTAKSVIVLFNSGGMPQHDTFDPKPEAPTDMRSPYAPIATRTPGLYVSELMPRTAQLTDQIAVIRTMVTGDNAHSSSGYQMLTGIPHAPLSQENAKPGKPNDWPVLGGLVNALRGPRGGIPAAIHLPRRMANNNGQDPWPGTDAGILGRRYDPWLLECDPADPQFTVPGGELRDAMSDSRLGQRRSLLKEFDTHAALLRRTAAGSQFDLARQQAVDLVAGGQARVAFDLRREPDAIRDRYGRHTYGQSVLLARRLVEAGVSLVQVQWVSQDKTKPNGGGWDTHEKHNESVKGWLVPVMDQVYATLLEDLQSRGLLDETLVCLVTEFGHTPKINARAGRDHWGRCFSIALAGGGVRGGVVLGKSDRQAADPIDRPIRPCDYLATVFHCLGFPPHTIVHDFEGRPLPISRGQVIDEILA